MVLTRHEHTFNSQKVEADLSLDWYFLIRPNEIFFDLKGKRLKKLGLGPGDKIRR